MCFHACRCHNTNLLYDNLGIYLTLVNSYIFYFFSTLALFCGRIDIFKKVFHANTSEQLF